MKNKVCAQYVAASGLTSSKTHEYGWLCEKIANQEINVPQPAPSSQSNTLKPSNVDLEVLHVLHQSLLFLAEINDLYSK
jgi:hypothetical protein